MNTKRAHGNSWTVAHPYGALGQFRPGHVCVIDDYLETLDAP